MAEGHETTTILKLGFLNEGVDRLMQYVGKDAYDCVAVNDGTFESVLGFLRFL